MVPADNVEALLEAGLKAYGNNDLETAARFWRRVLELQPDNAQAKDFLITAGFELPAVLARVVDLGEVRLQRADSPSRVVDNGAAPKEPSRATGEDLSREALRARVEKLVQERKLEAALEELDRARPRFPEDASISRSIRLLRDRLVFEYGKALGRLDDIPRLVVARDIIAKARPSAEEQALLKLIDGIVSLGDLVRSSQLGRFETYKTFVRFLDRGWIQMRAPTGAWDPREYLPLDSLPKARSELSAPSPVSPDSGVAVTAASPSIPSAPSVPPSLSATPNSPTESLETSESFDSLFREATEAYVRREYSRAIELFSRCLALRPEDRRVQHNLQRLQSRRNS